LNGELAQAIALATHGSVWLRESLRPAPDLGSSSTFDYVQSITFVLERREIASGVAKWFEGLRGRGVRRLWLEIPGGSQRGHWLADHLASAFAGGGRWLLLATSDTFAEVWRPSWNVDRDASDGRIWKIDYLGERVTLRVPRSPRIGDAAATLRETLLAARGFAARTLPDFVESFALALDALDGRGPGPPYYRDMLPDSYPSTSRALVAACAHAWVFGGMGSWNDAGFTDDALKRRHDELSRALWHDITMALVAAVNADLDSQPSPGTTTPAS